MHGINDIVAGLKPAKKGWFTQNDGLKKEGEILIEVGKPDVRWIKWVSAGSATNMDSKSKPQYETGSLDRDGDGKKRYMELMSIAGWWFGT